MKRSASLALFVPLAAMATLAVVGRQSASSLPSSPATPRSAVAPPSVVAPPRVAAAPTTTDDGELPEGVTPADEQWAGVARLRPALLAALRDAAGRAAADGITIQVNSGWRSPEYQRRLLDAAVATYGSEEAAARWVAPVSSSRHVSGDAVDVGPFAAASWLAMHGATYGLCRVYENEPWHFELRPGAVDAGCPARYADASVDPRMQP